jgi:V8-like Glu-specific endopeptidase
MEADSEEVWVNEMDTGDLLYRVKEKEMKDIPHRLIGVLLCRAKTRGTLIKGTAFLISPDLVLTCSHNLYDKEYSEEYYNVRFYPGHFGVLNTKTGGYEVESIFVPPEYKS